MKKIVLILGLLCISTSTRTNSPVLVQNPSDTIALGVPISTKPTVKPTNILDRLAFQDTMITQLLKNSNSYSYGLLSIMNKLCTVDWKSKQKVTTLRDMMNLLAQASKVLRWGDSDSAKKDQSNPALRTAYAQYSLFISILAAPFYSLDKQFNYPDVSQLFILRDATSLPTDALQGNGTDYKTILSQKNAIINLDAFTEELVRKDEDYQTAIEEYYNQAMQIIPIAIHDADAQIIKTLRTKQVFQNLISPQEARFVKGCNDLAKVFDTSMFASIGAALYIFRLISDASKRISWNVLNRMDFTSKSTKAQFGSLIQKAHANTKFRSFLILAKSNGNYIDALEGIFQDATEEKIVGRNDDEALVLQQYPMIKLQFDNENLYTDTVSKITALFSQITDFNNISNDVAKNYLFSLLQRAKVKLDWTFGDSGELSYTAFAELLALALRGSHLNGGMPEKWSFYSRLAQSEQKTLNDYYTKNTTKKFTKYNIEIKIDNTQPTPPAPIPSAPAPSPDATAASSWQQSDQTRPDQKDAIPATAASSPSTPLQAFIPKAQQPQTTGQAFAGQQPIIINMPATPLPQNQYGYQQQQPTYQIQQGYIPMGSNAAYVNPYTDPNLRTIPQYVPRQQYAQQSYIPMQAPVQQIQYAPQPQQQPAEYGPQPQPGGQWVWSAEHRKNVWIPNQ